MELLLIGNCHVITKDVDISTNLIYNPEVDITTSIYQEVSYAESICTVFLGDS